jgi:integrase/recombinase XerD
MNITKAINQYLAYQKSGLKPGTFRHYEKLLKDLQADLEDRDIGEITSAEVFAFLSPRTEGLKQSTKHQKYAFVMSFFNFCINVLEVTNSNPCNSSLLRKAFRRSKLGRRTILNKEILDEAIFRTPILRDRLFLEIQARSGLRIGEVLNLRVKDIDGRKLVLAAPKSGKDAEEAYMPESLATRLASYIQKNGLKPDERIFPLSYSGGRRIVVLAGQRVGIRLRPHDLRRHSATYASRSGMPLEVISKMILRHQSLLTTQRYLGKISDAEALHWVDRVHGV